MRRGNESLLGVEHRLPRRMYLPTREAPMIMTHEQTLLKAQAQLQALCDFVQKAGADRLRPKAEATMAEVRERMGLR